MRVTLFSEERPQGKVYIVILKVWNIPEIRKVFYNRDLAIKFIEKYGVKI